MLAQAYPQQNQGASTNTSAFSMGKDLSLKVIAQIGTFFGALIFGWLADTRGRKRMCQFFPQSIRPVVLLLTVNFRRWD